MKCFNTIDGFIVDCISTVFRYDWGPLWSYSKFIFKSSIFSGENEPDSLNFLTDFVSEYKSLINSGTRYTMHLLQFKTHTIICDAPARSFIKTVKGQASYSRCRSPQ